MKKNLFSLLLLVGISATAQVKIGNNPTVIGSASLLELESTTRGFLPPRMTTAERTAITSPSTGLQVYDTTTNSNWYFNGTIWVQSASMGFGCKWTNDAINSVVRLTNLSDGVTPRLATNSVTITDAGNLGIGTATPNAPLQFDNINANRKIVLWDSANNDHEFAGLGFNNNTFRFHTNRTASDYAFFAATKYNF